MLATRTLKRIQLVPLPPNKGGGKTTRFDTALNIRRINETPRWIWAMEMHQ